MNPVRKKVLLYGGTFDPPHKAHVELPYHIADEFRLDEVWFLPAGNPPHKSRVVTPWEHREAMLLKTLSFRSRTQICYYDMWRTKPCYTVDTLESLTAASPEIKFHLLMGTDQAFSFETWDKYRDIVELAKIIVMTRPPATEEEVRQKLPKILQQHATVFKPPQMDVSSTALRELLVKGKYEDPMVQNFLYPQVIQYIKEKGLYR